MDAAKSDTDLKPVGFGRFKVQDRPEREGRNPATGEAMTFPASRGPAFTPAKAVKDVLNG